MDPCYDITYTQERALFLLLLSAGIDIHSSVKKPAGAKRKNERVRDRERARELTLIKKKGSLVSVLCSALRENE